jgi:hypothetical protein
MKRRLFFHQRAMATGFSAALVMVLSAAAAPPAKTAAPEAAPRSVFAIPTKPAEGRDPFFPASMRPYESVQAAQPHVVEISSLVLKGISGPPGNRLAIINNRTFAVDDEQDLVTSQGRIRVRCVEINNTSVVVESAGQRQELKYHTSNP